MSRVRYTCVGSGTCVPTESRGPACHLVEAGELRVLLDLGSGSLRSLARLGLSFADLNAVGITHRHMDHVADLLPLLFALRYSPGLERREPLTIFGYAGLLSDLKRLAGIFGEWVLDPGFELPIQELRPGASLHLAAGGAEARVTACAVNHTPEAVSFRMELFPDGPGGEVRRFAYTGDTGALPELVELARDVDLFVSECAFPDGEGADMHLTPSGLLPICASARPRRTVATHLYPVWDERGVQRLWRESLDRFGQDVPVVAAYDGLRVDLGEEPAC